jgi:hypothetical protein
MSPNQLRYAFTFTGVSIAIYLLLTTIMMFLYYGGDRFNPTLEGYNFFGSFFSDLGRTHGFTGKSTIWTSIPYMFSMVLMGSGVVVFFRVHKNLVPAGNKLVVKITTILGTISGLGYMAIALTPWNLVPKAHIYSVFSSFTAFMICSFLLFISIKQQPNYPKIFGIIFLAFGFFLAAYIFFLILGPSTEFESGRIVQGSGQKLLIYTQSILMIICCYGAYKHSARYA